MKKSFIRSFRFAAVFLLLIALLCSVCGCGGMEEAPKEVLQSIAEVTESVISETESIASQTESIVSEMESFFLVEESDSDDEGSDPSADEQEISSAQAPETASEPQEPSGSIEDASESESVQEGILEPPMEPEQPEDTLTVREDGEYTSKDEVALYIHQYGHLPSNYITKKKAEELGWVAKEGNLWKVAPGKSIGGGRFGNYEGILPEKNGRKYYECDIDFRGKSRGAKRIVYSNDGLIFYTEDHYETFEQLYG